MTLSVTISGQCNFKVADNLVSILIIDNEFSNRSSIYRLFNLWVSKRHVEDSTDFCRFLIGTVAGRGSET